MAVDELLSLDEEKEKQRVKWIGVYIAMLAVLLAICNVGGDNASKDAAKANLDATNLWAFFQAKYIRRTQYSLSRDSLERELLAAPNMPQELRTKINSQLTEYNQKIDEYTSEEESMEGLDELFVRAKALEKERDIALQRDPFFDYGLAFLQIAIVLASVAIIASGSFALTLSAIVGAVGMMFMINGFWLAPGLTPLLSAIMSW